MHVAFTRDDHGRTAATATAVTLTPAAAPTSTAGYLTLGDTDYFTMAIPAAGVFAWEINDATPAGTEGSTCAKYAWQDADGNVIRGGDCNAQVVEFVTAPGTYTLRIYSDCLDDLGPTGAYSLRTQFYVPPTLGMPSSTTTGTLSEMTSATSDVDYYQINVTGEGYLDATTTGATNTGGYLFEVADDGFNSLSDGDSGQDDNFRLLRPVKEAATYYLAVRNEAPAGSSDYTLSVRFSEEYPDDDHADTVDDATVVELPAGTPGTVRTALSVEGSIVPRGLRLYGEPSGTDEWVDFYNDHAQPADTDLFKITVDVTGQLLVHTDNSSLRGSGTLLDAEGAELATAEKRANGRFAIAHVVSAGTYYVEVKGHNYGEDYGFTGGPYTLHTRFIPDDDHGATRDTATDIALPSDNDAEDSATLLVHDSDYFKIVVPEPEDGEASGGELTVYTTGDTDPIGFLQTADGTELVRDTFSGSGYNFKFSRVVDPGTYYVLVKDAPGFNDDADALHHTRLGPYGLHVGFIANDGHGDTRETATVIELPSETDATLMADDTDFFKLTVETFGKLTLYTSGNAGTIRKLLDHHGNYLWAVSDDPATTPRFMEAGTYFVKIDSQFAPAFGEYQLHASFEAVQDEGDTRETAVEVALPSDTDASLSHTGDVDYFKVTVTQAGSLRVLAAPTLIPNTYGYLEDSEGTVLAENDDGETWHDLRNFRIEMDVEPGTYYVKVEGFVNSVLGDYELRTRFTPDETAPEPEDDHGDTPGTATVVGLSSDTDGVLKAGDVDYFAITVAANGYLTVTSSGSTDTAGQLEDGTGTVLAFDADSGAGSNFALTYTVSAGT